MGNGREIALVYPSQVGIMKTLSRIILATSLLASAGTAHAQMRVEGFRKADPRLKQQRIEQPVTALPPRVAADQIPNQAGLAIETSGQGQAHAPKAITTNPQAVSPTSSPQVSANMMPAQAGPVQAGGPLQRPTYLQPDPQAAPSGGPSALDLMKQCFDGSISGSIANPSCVGYMAGFVGAVRISASIGPGYPICLPEAGLANEAIVADVSSYLEENTAALQKSARSVVFLVLSQRYPCKEQ